MKTIKQQSSRQIRSKQMMFWLNLENTLHAEVWDIAENLKGRRRFNPSVVNGLRLIADLEAGKVDVLLELFPLIGHMLDTNGKSDRIGMDSEHNGRIISVLERIEKTLSLPALSSSVPSDTSQRGNPKLVEDDLEIDMQVATKEKNATPAWWDGLITVACLSETYTSLPPDILDYGIKIGRIPASAKKPTGNSPEPIREAKIESGKIPPKTRPKKIKATPSPKADGNSKHMDVPQFAAPSFDDEDDLPLSHMAQIG